MRQLLLEMPKLTDKNNQCFKQRMFFFLDVIFKKKSAFKQSKLFQFKIMVIPVLIPVSGLHCLVELAWNDSIGSNTERLGKLMFVLNSCKKNDMKINTLFS